MEGWLALAQVVRYHQPPGRRIRAITVYQAEELSSEEEAELADNLAVLRAVFPTLTSRGAYRNIHVLVYYGVENTGIHLLGALEHSHITHLCLNMETGWHARFVAAFSRLVHTGRLKYLCLHFPQTTSRSFPLSWRPSAPFPPTALSQAWMFA